MADFGYFPAVNRFVGDDETGYNRAVANTGANTKGSWVEMAASCPFDASGLIITTQSAGSNAYGMMDVGIGSAGSEVVLVPNILMRPDNVFSCIAPIYLPISIRKSERVCARVQGNTGATQYNPKFLFAAGAPSFQNCTDYGTVLANSTGTGVNASATINVKGSWTQLTASCSAMTYAMLCMQFATTGVNFQMDIGIGGAGSEVVIIPDLNLVNISASGPLELEHFGFPLSIPAGTRISVRAASNSSSAGIYVNLLGFN